MRGAALKLGQFISFQDDSMFSTKLMKALEKARNEANVMPPNWLEEIMIANFGSEYLDNMEYFENVPFAAASIGQVHKAKVDGMDVAIKIQFPGVKESIDSDIANM